MPDFQPIVDAGAFYLYTLAMMKLIEPLFVIILLSIFGWAAWKVIKWIMWTSPR